MHAVRVVILLAGLLPPAVGSNAEIFWKNPFPDEGAALEHVKEIGLRVLEGTDQQQTVDLIAGVKILEDGWVQFDPLYDHHMAVEYWFVTNAEALSVPEARRPFIVRVTGRVRLHAFGVPPVYGEGGGLPEPLYRASPTANGLAPGGNYMREGSPVRGYHERIYVIEIEEVGYVIPFAEFQREYSSMARDRKAGERLVDEEKPVEALVRYRSVVEKIEKLGLRRSRLFERDYEFATAMAYLADPASREDEDFIPRAGAIAARYVRGGYLPGLGKRGRTTVESFLASVDTADRPLIVDVFLAAHDEIEHRHQKEKLVKAIQDFGGSPSFDEFMARRTQALERRDNNVSKIETAATTGDFDTLVSLVRDSATIDGAYGMKSGGFDYGKGLAGAELCEQMKKWSSSDRARLMTELRSIMDRHVRGKRLSKTDREILVRAVNACILPSLRDDEKRDFEAHLLSVMDDVTAALRLQWCAESLAPVAGPEGLERMKSLVGVKYVDQETLTKLIGEVRARLER